MHVFQRLQITVEGSLWVVKCGKHVHRLLQNNVVPSSEVRKSKRGGTTARAEVTDHEAEKASIDDAQ